MRFDIKNLTFLSLITAALIVGGYFLYIASKTLPVPGSKFIFMAPYLSIFMYIAVSKTKRLWTITVINLILGLIMSLISPIMSIAIFLSGLLTDLTTIIFVRDYGFERNIKISASLYPVWSFITSIWLTSYVTGSCIYGLIGIKVLILLIIIIYILSFIGVLIGGKLKRRLNIV